MIDLDSQPQRRNAKSMTRSDSFFTILAVILSRFGSKDSVQISGANGNKVHSLAQICGGFNAVSSFASQENAFCILNCLTLISSSISASISIFLIKFQFCPGNVLKSVLFFENMSKNSVIRYYYLF